MQNQAAASRLTGTRIRHQRLALGRRQVALAAEVGISPAYLNLIEHNKRRIGGKLLVDLARALGVEPGELSEGGEAAQLGMLSAAGARHGEGRAELDRVGELAGRFPGWAGVIAAQHGRIRELERLVEALSDRLSHDPQLAATLHEVLSTVTAIRSAVSILSDEGEVDPEWQARFLRNVAEDAARLSDAAQGLAGFLESGAGEEAAHMSPQEELGQFLGRHGYFFAGLEPGGGGDVGRVLKAGRAVLRTPAAQDLARHWLARYQRDAASMPRPAFAAAWAGAGGDPLPVAAHFAVSPDAVLRRAACSGQHGEIGLVICDGTGTLTTRRLVAGFAVPRFGAACGRWPLFQALAQPGRPVAALVEMPGDPKRRFRCQAFARLGYPAGSGDVPVVEATMLVLPADEAGMAAVGPGGGVSGGALSVGPGCRVCPRARCPARREMSLLALEE